MSAYNERRRWLLKGACAIPFASSTWGAYQSKPTSVSRPIDVSRYTHALVPRGHGEIIALGKRYSARYPSRYQSMQFMAFFGDRDGLYVQSHDTTGYITDWDITADRSLTIRFYGPETDVTTAKIGTDWQAAADLYKKWALKQQWARRKQPTSAPSMSIICMAASRNLAHMRKHVPEFVQYFEGPRASWITQWRSHPFDVMYPDYSPSDKTQFRRLLAELHAINTSPLPYVNGLLVDDRIETFNSLTPYLLVNSSGKNEIYSNRLSHLKYMCPTAAGWQAMLSNIRRGLLDENNTMSRGVYLDLLAAAPPSICYATNHDHLAADPLVWSASIRAILKDTPGLVMVEGNAEVYIDCVDIFLMHYGTEKPDSTIVPLWNSVYGDVTTFAGWRIAPESPAAIQRSINRAISYGTGFFGSPWMEADTEIVLLNEPNRKTLRHLVANTRPAPPQHLTTRTKT